MKRAVVWKVKGPNGYWWACIGRAEHYQPNAPMHLRLPRTPGASHKHRTFPTHETAMAAALAEVGLATPPEQREAP